LASYAAMWFSGRMFLKFERWSEDVREDR
jgi:hypothetical protein